MSRASTAGIALIGGAVGLTAFLMTRGLPEDARQAAQEIEAAVQTAEAQVKAQREKLKATLTEDAAFFEALPDVGQARSTLDRAQQRLEAVRARSKAEVQPILKKDSYGDREKLFALTVELGVEALSATRDIEAPVAQVKALHRYKTQHRQLMNDARQALLDGQHVVEDAALTGLIESAGTRYPEVAKALETRLSTLRTRAKALVAQGLALDKTLGVVKTPPPTDLLQAAEKIDSADPAEAAAAKAAAETLAAMPSAAPSEPKDPQGYVAAGQAAEAIIQTGQAVSSAQADLVRDVAGLGKSEDRILVDMRRKGGTCEHKYRVVKDGVAKVTPWRTVSCSLYASHTEHLGMAIYSKPEGTFETEAVTIASPPGYSYVGNPRYGRWEQRNGGSFWVFYGRYALTRDLLWGGGGYRPIRQRSHTTWRSNVRAKKPYYGPNKEYGSRGSLTKTKYAGSAFLTTKRYSSSKFRSSGTKYSGSRYGSGSGSSRRGGSYRSRGSRGGSSFGGSGK